MARPDRRTTPWAERRLLAPAEIGLPRRTASSQAGLAMAEIRWRPAVDFLREQLRDRALTDRPRREASASTNNSVPAPNVRSPGIPAGSRTPASCASKVSNFAGVARQAPLSISTPRRSCGPHTSDYRRRAVAEASRLAAARPEAQPSSPYPAGKHAGQPDDAVGVRRTGKKAQQRRIQQPSRNTRSVSTDGEIDWPWLHEASG